MFKRGLILISVMMLMFLVGCESEVEKQNKNNLLVLQESIDTLLSEDQTDLATEVDEIAVMNPELYLTELSLAGGSLDKEMKELVNIEQKRYSEILGLMELREDLQFASDDKVVKEIINTLETEYSKYSTFIEKQKEFIEE